jgi:hypothetical protein
MPIEAENNSASPARRAVIGIRGRISSSGLFGDVGIAEVPVQKSADPVQILQHQRLIDAELALEIGLVGRIDEARRIEQDIDDIAGHDAQQAEDDDRDSDQRHEHQGETPHDISQHEGLLPLSV